MSKYLFPEYRELLAECKSIDEFRTKFVERYGHRFAAHGNVVNQFVRTKWKTREMYVSHLANPSPDNPPVARKITSVFFTQDEIEILLQCNTKDTLTKKYMEIFGKTLTAEALFSNVNSLWHGREKILSRLAEEKTERAEREKQDVAHKTNTTITKPKVAPKNSGGTPNVPVGESLPDVGVLVHRCLETQQITQKILEEISSDIKTLVKIQTGMNTAMDADIKLRSEQVRLINEAAKRG